MKKNFTPNFENKLARYSAVAGTFVAAGAVNAQVTYVDINPDIVYANSSGAIDITGDSNADFFFVDSNYVASNAWFAAVVPIGTQGVAGDLGTYNYPFKMALNDPINSTLTWLTGSATGSMALSINSAFPYSGSHWQGDATDGYLGLKLDISGQTFYGWLRVSVAANTQSMTLKDFGFDATPNTPILAGAMPPVGVPELIGKISVFNYNNLLTVNVLETITNGTLTVVSMTGQIVHSSAVTTNTTVDLNSLAAGIYTVNIQSEEGILVQKIMIK